MKLYLVRHATATERLGGAVQRDQDRPLVHEGEEEAHAMAIALRRLGIRGDVFLASPYLRTRQTAELFAEVLSHTYAIELSDALAPGGDHHQLLEQLAGRKHLEHIFLFSHMPDICQLAGMLLCLPDMDVQFKKSAVCCIEVYDLPPTRPGSLKWLITPKLVQACKK